MFSGDLTASVSSPEPFAWPRCNASEQVNVTSPCWGVPVLKFPMSIWRHLFLLSNAMECFLRWYGDGDAWSGGRSKKLPGVRAHPAADTQIGPHASAAPVRQYAGAMARAKPRHFDASEK